LAIVETGRRKGSENFTAKEEGKNNVKLNNFEDEQGNTKLKEKSAILSLKSLAKAS